MNPFGAFLFFVKYVTFTTSSLDVVRLRKDMRYRIALRRQRAMMDVTSRLIEYDQHNDKSQNDWSILRKPMSLLMAVKRFHLMNGYTIIFSLLQTILTLYIIIKCVFHIILTGEDYELATYYERNYYFPRLFSSHETPQIFYTHCLLLLIYCFSIRLLAISRLIYYSVVNVDYYKQLSISHINSNLVEHLDLSPREWIVTIKYGLQYPRRCKLDYEHLKRHLSINTRLIEKTADINLGELIYTENLIDFYKCHKETLENQLDNPAHAYWSGNPRSWPRFSIDPYFFSICLLLLLGGSSLLLMGIASYFFCLIDFEIAGAVREREKGAEFSFIQTLAYMPKYLEEPWRLIRFFDMLIFFLIQLPCQVDAFIYCSDILILISRAHKVLDSLEQVRDLCILGAGQYYQQLFSQYSSSFERSLDHHAKSRPSAAISMSTFTSSKKYNLIGCADKQPKYGATCRKNLIAEDEVNERGREESEKRDSDDENEFNSDDDEDTRDLRVRYNSWRAGSSKIAIDYLSVSEEARLNRRLQNLIKLCHILKKEFVDTKSYHMLYLNTMIIYSGFYLAYSMSLMLGATSFATFFILGSSITATSMPLVVAVLLSIALDSVFKDIHRNLNQMIVNAREYLSRKTVKQLMIESHSFESARDRSIQIAGQFSITPGSLGPLVAYISTCVLLLKRI